MGRDLYETEPVARAVLDRCEEAFRAERGASLLDVMFAQGEGNLNDTAWAHPALYAIECAVTALWESLGVRPDVVVGHSVGEFAAAHTAGMFGLEDGMRAVMGRSEILSSVPEAGTMAAVFAPFSEVEAAVREHNETAGSERLAIAARNGAHQVLSGQVAAVEAVSGRFEAERSPGEADQHEPGVPQPPGGAGHGCAGSAFRKHRDSTAFARHACEQRDGPGGGAG